mgnify:FL=1
MIARWKQSRTERYVFLLLFSAEVILTFTSLGYIHAEPISVTTAYLPVLAAAVLYGVEEATLMGLFFGLGSMYKASAAYVLTMDRIFSPFYSGAPFASFLLSVGTRAAFGFLIGLLFQAAKKGRPAWLWNSLVAMLAPFLHAFLVYLVVRCCFPAYDPLAAARDSHSWCSYLVVFLCAGVVLLCERLRGSEFVRRYKEALDAPEAGVVFTSRLSVFLGVTALFVICMAGFSAGYFSQRVEFILTLYGIPVTPDVRTGILHLQTQFLFSMLALDFILTILVQMVYHYMKYQQYRGEIDYLTGVMGRRLFLRSCTRRIRACSGQPGWFLFLDIDYFKEINDTQGHATGDEVLRRVAERLSRRFEARGLVGRMGGDEFAVLIDSPLSHKELRDLLDGFLADVAAIPSTRRLSCSIGAYRFISPMEIKELLSETDRALYAAKENGRACYVIRGDGIPAHT